MHDYPLHFLRPLGRTGPAMIVLLLLAVTACRDPEPQLPSPQVDSTNTLTKDLMRTMQETGQLDTFLTALDQTHISDELAHTQGPFTVFAPLNKAFATSPARLDTAYLTGSADSLRKLIRYHVAYGRFDVSSVDGDSLRISTLAQMPVTLERTDSSLVVDDQRVVRTIETRNGLLHIVPALLTPPLPDTTQQSPFSDLPEQSPSP